MSEKPTIDIIADKLLCALRAAAPFAGKDEESPQHMMLRFAGSKASMEVSATDGVTLCVLDVPVEEVSEPVTFCVMATHVPMLIKVLSRLDAEKRAELVMPITVGRTKVKFEVGETELFVPKAAEQTDFPFVERAIPRKYIGGKKTTPNFALAPDLVARIMRAASHVANSLEWTVPATATEPIRLDIVENTSGITGLFVFAPMKLGDGSALQKAGQAFRKAAKGMGAKMTVTTPDGRQTVIAHEREG